jgi:serine/threonine protein kinase
MNPLVRSLFDELVDVSRSERERLFAERSITPEVRSEVESLLDYDSLDTSAEVYWGPYKRVRVLGSGGMSTVYLAERTDGEIQQLVAIKFLRTDIQRPAWRERFLKERQLLSYLNHSSIAHLIDAGHTKDGRPYLVMEYVDGVPIDEYASSMDINEQLRLFLNVCDAVSYAHRRLIIHRDLKPSNILVDRSGQPKLLDFGIAKLLDDNRNRTLTIERLLTPNYASPEQLQGIEQTTATDVYSLGAVLHKILLGTSPNEPAKAKSTLPSDVDYILRKALRAEPEERYGSVDAFADDIRAFLDWRPVQARSGDVWYRTRKFLRRYWVPVTAALLVSAGLSIGLYIANRERQIAQRRFDQVRQLSNKVLGLDRSIRGLPDSTMARTEIVAMSKQYLEALMAEGQPTQGLALELASAFVTLAEVQGVPRVANLGQYDQADASLVQANQLTERILAASPRNRSALLLSSEINLDRMILADTMRHRDAVPTFAENAGQRMDAFLAIGLPSNSERDVLSNIATNLGLAYKNLHRYTDSIRYGKQAVALVSPSSSYAPAAKANALSIVADSMRYMGDLDSALATINEARTFVESVALPDRDRPTSLHSIYWRQGMILGADGQISLMRTDDAIAAFQRSYDVIEAAAIKDSHEATIRILFIEAARELGGLLRSRDPRRSLVVYDHAISRLKEVPKSPKSLRGEAQLLAASSYALRSLNRTVEARQRVDAAFDLLREAKRYPAESITTEDEVGTALLALGDHLAETGDTRHAVEKYQELLTKLMASQPDPENDVRHASALSHVYDSLARVFRRIGDAVEADAYSAKRLKIWQSWNRKLPNNQYIQHELTEATAS